MNEGVFDRLDEKIQLFSTRILSESEILEAEGLSKELFGTESERAHAISFMQEKMGKKPKRPMFYLNWELGHLPDQTRDIIRYAGDYIDHLIKHMAEENILVFKSLGLHRSLGTNIKKLEKKLGVELYENLKLYNECLYVPAKHDFQVNGYPHRFSPYEAIYACYITFALGEIIRKLSPNAERYASNKSYYYSGRD